MTTEMQNVFVSVNGAGAYFSKSGIERYGLSTERLSSDRARIICGNGTGFDIYTDEDITLSDIMVDGEPYNVASVDERHFYRGCLLEDFKEAMRQDEEYYFTNNITAHTYDDLVYLNSEGLEYRYFLSVDDMVKALYFKQPVPEAVCGHMTGSDNGEGEVVTMADFLNGFPKEKMPGFDIERLKIGDFAAFTFKDASDEDRTGFGYLLAENENGLHCQFLMEDGSRSVWANKSSVGGFEDVGIEDKSEFLISLARKQTDKEVDFKEALRMLESDSLEIPEDDLVMPTLSDYSKNNNEYEAEDIFAERDGNQHPAATVKP